MSMYPQMSFPLSGEWDNIEVEICRVPLELYPAIPGILTELIKRDVEEEGADTTFTKFPGKVLVIERGGDNHFFVYMREEEKEEND